MSRGTRPVDAVIAGAGFAGVADPPLGPDRLLLAAE
jgi:hypothetical protein